MNELFEARELQPGNRGLFSTKALKRGKKVMELQPLAWATLKPYKGQICNWCLLKKQTVRCASCKSFYYCSQNCQRNDWPSHKLECSIYKKMAQEKKLSVHTQIPTELVLNLRIALLRKHNPAFETTINSLVSLQEHQPLEKLQGFQEMALVLLENMGEERNQGNLASLIKQMCAVSVNAFTIQDFLCETDGVGTGIFHPANLLNHDCSPNCTQYFDGRYLNIITNRDIEPKQELTISYTNPLLLVQQRRAFLRKNYLFECFCQLCQVQQMLNNKFNYILCPHCHKSNLKPTEEPSLYTCLHCEKNLTKQELVDCLERAEKEMENFTKLQSQGELKKGLFALKKMVSLDHPFFCEAIDRVYQATINQLGESDRQEKLMEEAYILMKEQINRLNKWYRLGEGENHNVRFFLKYAHFGKLCYNLGKFQKAAQYTELAQEIVNQVHLKNKYAEVMQLQQRNKQIAIELSIAKSRSFNQP